MTRFHPTYINTERRPRLTPAQRNSRVRRQPTGALPLVTNAEFHPNDGQVRVMHHTTAVGNDDPLCGIRLSELWLMSEREPRGAYRLCARCVRKAARINVALVRETIVPSGHTTAAPFGTLAIDHMDREDIQTLAQREGGLHAYLAAWNYQSTGAN